MPSQTVALSSVASSLKVEFTLQGDRFHSRILSAQQLVLASSIEGTAKKDETSHSSWPLSPPLQEVVPQETGGDVFLAGIGRAGKSHWSVIIKPLSEKEGFDFDFACRAKELPAWLGSSYSLSELASAADGNLGLQITSACSEVESDGLNVQITPRLDVNGTYPQTIQWRYQIAISEEN